MTSIEDLLGHVIPGIIKCWGFTWAQLLIKLDQSRVSNLHVAAQLILRFLIKRVLDVGMIRVGVHVSEQSKDLFVRACTDQS